VYRAWCSEEAFVSACDVPAEAFEMAVPTPCGQRVARRTSELVAA
jgi:hypothetical protein